MTTERLNLYQEFEFLDLVDFGGVVFSMEFIMRLSWHDSFICEAHSLSYVSVVHTWVWFICECGSYVRPTATHAAFRLVAVPRECCLIHVFHHSFMCETTHYVSCGCTKWVLPHSCAIWLIHVWHDSSMCLVAAPSECCLIHVGHDLFMRDILTFVRHDSFMCVRHHTWVWVMSNINTSCHTWISHVSHGWVKSYMNESCHTWMSHVTHGRVMSHMDETALTWGSHKTH